MFPVGNSRDSIQGQPNSTSLVVLDGARAEMTLKEEKETLMMQ